MDIFIIEDHNCLKWLKLTRMKPKNFHMTYPQNPPKLPHTQIPKSNTWWSIGSKMLYDSQNLSKEWSKKNQRKEKTNLIVQANKIEPNTP